MEIRTKWCSSLVKVLPAEEPVSEPYDTGMALAGEIFSFQLAYQTEIHDRDIRVSVESDLKKYITVRSAALVAVNFTGSAFDDDYLSSVPGVFPDPLCELKNNTVRAVYNQWRSLWFKVSVPRSCKPGKYKIHATLESDVLTGTGTEAVKTSRTFVLEVLPAKIPVQKLINTHWFHTDCLAVYYKTDIFSEEYWRITGNFMKNAAEHGINMILTPVFTPPLDTQIGGERPTVQLVDVTVKKGGYTFGFSRLDRWIELAEKCGIKYFEISHLFTQWGAKAAPKIMAKVNGKEKRIFGWDTQSDSKEYTAFLDAFLPVFTAYLKKKKLGSRVYFHCSDEPKDGHLDSYSKAARILQTRLKGFKIMDALSNLDYYQRGLVRIPVPQESKLEDFIRAGVKERWTYYCCGPRTIYSNRFIHMPSSRNRIMGTLMYRHGVQGFLHWGFNFYFSSFSRYPVDPWKTADSDCAFPAGDPFLVYPGADGFPVDSIRHEVFTEGLQDQRVLQLLETKMPREKIEQLLDRLSPGSGMTMADYPRGEKNVLALRKKINQLIKKHFNA